MAWSKLGLPVFVGSCIAPFQHTLKLFVSPGIKVDGFDSANVGAHATVDARTANADKDPEVPARPSRVFVTFAVSADFVPLEFDQSL